MARRRILLAAVRLVAGASTLLGTCASASAYIYWPSGSAQNQGILQSANPDGTGPQLVNGDVSASGGVATDGSHVYLVEGLDPAIGRVNPDGTGLNTAFVHLPAPTCAPGTHLPASAQAIAVDGSYIYWSDPLFGTIGRASIVDGSSANGAFLRGAGGECGTSGTGSGSGGLAVGGGHIYWTNRDAGTIGRAGVDGSGATQSFISGAYQPNGLAVGGSDVYWTNNDPSSFGAGAIGHAVLDGSGALIPASVNQSFITGVSADGSLATSGGYLYFDTADGWIGRSTLDGSAITRHLVQFGDAGHPVGGLAADAGVAAPTTTTVSCSPQPIRVLDPQSGHYLADGVDRRDKATCTLSVRDTSGSPDRVSGLVHVAVTPGRAFFLPTAFDGTCSLAPTGRSGESGCSVSFESVPFGPGYVRGAPLTVTAAYGGETLHAASTASPRVPVTTMYGCDFRGDGYYELCDARGFVLFGGPRGKGGHTTSFKVKLPEGRVTVTVPRDCVMPRARFSVEFAFSGHARPRRIQVSLGTRRVTLTRAPYIARLSNPSGRDGDLVTLKARVLLGPPHGRPTSRTVNVRLYVC